MPLLHQTVKSLLVFSLPGLLVTLGLFWLMHIMLTTQTQTTKKIETPKMMELMPVLQQEKGEQGKAGGKPVIQPQKVLSEPKPTPLKKPIPKVQKKVVEKPLPKEVIEKPVVKEMPVKPVAKIEKPLDVPVPARNATAVQANALAGQTDNHPKGGGVVHSNASSSAIVSTGAVLLEKVDPKYPRRAFDRHIEGWVKVEFTITVEGTVSDPKVIVAEPAEIFDDAALTAISQFRFKAKTVGGAAVSQRATQTIQFKLTNE